MKNPLNHLLSIFIVIVVIGLAIFVYIDKYQVSETPSPSTSPLPTASSTEGIQTFISKELGISFQYAALQTPNMLAKVKQIGNKVYIAVGDTAIETGQFVEVFSKPADETFTDSVRRQILTDYPSTQCTIETAPSNIQGGYWVAEIGYPEISGTEGPSWANASLCNENYAKTNGIRYFLYDPKHPTIFAYLDIGQYSIFWNDQIPWQYSLTFINKD